MRIEDEIDEKMNVADVEERQLSHLMMECLAIFEGGDIREEFSTPWVLFQIGEMVDSFIRIQDLVVERRQSRKLLFDIAMGMDEDE